MHPRSGVSAERRKLPRIVECGYARRPRTFSTVRAIFASLNRMKIFPGRPAFCRFLLALVLLVAANASGENETADAEAARNWLATNAIPLDTVEAGHGFADLQPFKKIISSARIVSLGEATHGTCEFFQLKHRLLEFLVNEMGFNVFIMEASMPESFDINDYVLTGQGDPRKALAGIYFWTWDTKEVLAMIEWMRSYNADPKHVRKLKFYGNDIQSPSRAAKVTLTYLRKIDPREAETAESNLELLANPYTASAFNGLSKGKQAAIAEAVKTILSNFDEHKEDYIARSSAEEWALARQHARVLSQNVEMQRTDPRYRDLAMAENTRWILEQEGPQAKAMVWAHNGHVSAGKAGNFPSMGWYLRQAFGSNMVVFGLVFDQGGFQSREMPFLSGARA
jgi:erythromycin esterase